MTVSELTHLLVCSVEDRDTREIVIVDGDGAQSSVVELRIPIDCGAPVMLQVRS
jgi:DNA gyrase/topoisomerase IV subunit B